MLATKHYLRWLWDGVLPASAWSLALAMTISVAGAQTSEPKAATTEASDVATQRDSKAANGEPNSVEQDPPQLPVLDSAEDATETATPTAGSAPDAEGPSLANGLSGTLTDVGPDTFLLPDANGKPQPVLNMSIQDFIEAWKLRQSLVDTQENSSADYTLEECEVVGSLEANYATLTATFLVRLHSSQASDVSLGFSGAVLRKLPQSPSKQNGRFLRRDPQGAGYVVALTGQPDEVVQVDLEFWAPIRREGDRASLRLLTPRANKSSLLLVSKDTVNSVAAGEGTLLSTKSLVAGGSRIEAQHNGGEITLRWQDNRQLKQQFDSVLTSKGKVFATIDGNTLRMQAELTVQSFGRPFREFAVRLPAGAELIPGELPDEVESLEPIGAAEAFGERSEMQVTLKTEQLDPVTLTLDTKQSLPATGALVDVELAGFEVVGAVSQNGELGIQINDDWQLRTGRSESVAQVDTQDIDLSWQTPAIAPDDVDMALHYLRQPWTLPAQIVPRQQRAVATPSYNLSIGPNEARLEMRIEYQVSGVGRAEYRFAPGWILAGWEQKKTETKGLRDLEGLVRKQYNAANVEPLDILGEYGGFVKGIATRDNPEVVVALRKPLPPGADRFVLELPYPDQPELAINSSELVVSADPSIRLSPDPAAHVGLNVEPIIDTEDSANDRPPGQQFRYRGFQPNVKFAGKKEERAQRVLSKSISRVLVSGDKIAVEQDIEFDVRHQPASDIRLTVPRRVPIELELISNDESAEFGTELEIPDRDAAVIESGPMMPEWVVPLPHQRLGKFRVRARYALPPPGASTNFVLKLIGCPGTEFQDQRVSIESSLAEALAPVAGSGWELEPSATNSDRNGATVLTTSQPTTFVPLTYSGRIPTSETLEVDKVWVQTWLTSGTRQQRTVIQYRGEGPIRIELPGDLPSGETIEVKLDGQSTANVVGANGSISVDYRSAFDSPGKETSKHTIELLYRVPNAVEWMQHLAVDRPRLVGDDSGAAVYWQLVTPVQQTYLAAPAELVKAFRTRWTSSGWRAEPAKATSELEAWIGVSTDLEPTLGEQSMLLRGWSDTPLQATLIRRELLVLGVSMGVLTCCLALIYVPWLRKAPILIGGLAVIVLAGIAVPQAAVLVGQFGLFGGVCGVVAALLYLLVRRATLAARAARSSVSHSAATNRGSTVAPIYSGPISTNAPTVSMEMTDSNV